MCSLLGRLEHVLIDVKCGSHACDANASNISIQDPRTPYQPTFTIKNLDDALYQTLKTRAAHEHRSIAQQITHILETALGSAESPSILDLEGLGRELWTDKDAAEHVAAERDAWD